MRRQPIGHCRDVAMGGGVRGARSRAVRTRPRRAGRRGDAPPRRAPATTPSPGWSSRTRTASWRGPSTSCCRSRRAVECPECRTAGRGSRRSSAKRVTRDVEPSVRRCPRQASSCPGRSVDDRMARRAMAGWSEVGFVRRARERPRFAARVRGSPAPQLHSAKVTEKGRSFALPPFSVSWAGPAAVYWRRRESTAPRTYRYTTW